MKQPSDGSNSETPPATPIQAARKPPAIAIVATDGFEGVLAGPVGPTVTTVVISCEMVWLGRNIAGEITEVLWDSDTSFFRAEDFEKSRAKSPFRPFTILMRNGGPSVVVRHAGELFVGQEALVIQRGDGSTVTVPLRAIQAIELPDDSQPAGKESQHESL